jgi:signal transduction histidine kinase
VDGIVLIGLLTYTCGAFAYGMTLVFWMREVGRAAWPLSASRFGALREVDVVNGAMLVVSFLWFCVNAVVVFLQLGPRWSARQLDVGTIVLAFAFPPLIMHTVLAEVASAGRMAVTPMWRALLWPAYVAAALIPAFSITVFLSAQSSAGLREVAGRLLGYGLPVLFVGAGIYSVALIGRQPEQPKASARQERRWLLGLFASMMLLFVALLVVGVLTGDARGRPVRTALLLEIEIAAKSLPLMFIFVGAYFENRFDFFDLFVKRGLGLLVSIGVMTLGFGLLLPVLRAIGDRWTAPWLYAVAMLPLVAALPWIHGRIGRLLDRRWLGRRFTAVEAVKRMLTGLKSATTEAQLIAHAQEGLVEIFSASCLIHLGPDTPAPGFVVMHETPIQSGDDLLGRVLMGPRPSEARYFRDDVELLASIADLFASVLVNLRLQEKKKEQEQLAQELSLHASRSELKALRAQINPHFLFNALNAIAGLIHRNPRAADRTIEQLADVFRYALRGAESEWAALADELEFVAAYLEVERARFGDRLQTEVCVADEVRAARVPTMAVQTLVENAVKHGLSEVRGPAIVRVSARCEGSRLKVSVIDNGPGFSDAALAAADAAPGPRGGYGLTNIRQRLAGYFGPDGALTIDRDRAREETIVSICLPLMVDATVGAQSIRSHTERTGGGRETAR